MLFFRLIFALLIICVKVSLWKSFWELVIGTHKGECSQGFEG